MLTPKNQQSGHEHHRTHKKRKRRKKQSALAQLFERLTTVSVTCGHCGRLNRMPWQGERCRKCGSRPTQLSFRMRWLCILVPPFAAWMAFAIAGNRSYLYQRYIYRRTVAYSALFFGLQGVIAYTVVILICIKGWNLALHR